MVELAGFFHDDPKLPEDALNSIEILEARESWPLWDRWVSSNQRHFMLLSDDEWPSDLVRQASALRDYGDDWDRNVAASFGAWLRSCAQEANDDDALLVLYMRERCIRVPWSVFCLHWINFLYEDEGVVLVLPKHVHAFVLSNGRAWSGSRTSVA